MVTVNIREAKAQLSKLVDLAAKGEIMILKSKSDDQMVA